MQAAVYVMSVRMEVDQGSSWLSNKLNGLLLNV